MNHNDYISFFENLARKHVALQHTDTSKHFFRANIEELITGLRSKVLYPCMVLESYEVRLIDNKSDNIYLAPIGAFSIIKKVQNDNYNQENEFINDCMLIGIDIISAIRHEYKSMGTPAVSAARKIKYFDPATVMGQKIGPILDNCFGYRFEFQIGNPQGLAYDQTKWTN